MQFHVKIDSIFISTFSFQCILTRTDHELFYSGENAAGINHSQSLTCPFCGKLGYTETTLVDHVSSAHSDSSHDSQEVICPICASTPGDDPNYFVNRSDFSTHINLEHRSTGQRDLISFLDEPSRSGAGVRRVGRGGSSNGTGELNELLILPIISFFIQSNFWTFCNQVW